MLFCAGNTAGLRRTVMSTAEIIEEQLEECGAYALADALPSETEELLGDMGVGLSADGIGSLSFNDVFGSLCSAAEEASAEPLRACAAAVGIIVVCAVAASVTGREKNGSGKTFDMLGVLASVLTVCIPAVGPIDSAASVISGVCGFSAALVPVLSGIAVVSGHSAAAAAYSTFTLTVMEILAVLMSAVFVPLLRIFLGITLVGTLSPSLGLDRLTGTMEKYAKWLLGLLGVALSGILGISSLSASAADGAFARSTRFVVSNAVPVVGGAISDALGTITNCIGIVRNSVGAFGIIAGIYLVLPSAASSVLWMVCLNVTAWIADSLGAERQGTAMRSVSSVISLTLAMQALVTVMLICSTAMIMSLRGM